MTASEPDPLDRLEHALEAWLEIDGEANADPDTVLQRQSPEVRELLEPMLAAPAVEASESTGALGEFRLRQELGRGGMGVVFEAVDSRLERTVALKVVAIDELDSVTTRQRFQREAAAAARLGHPGICQIYGTGEVDGRLWISMERLSGGTLAQRMREPDGLPGEATDGRTVAAVRLVADLADAVAFAHRHQVVHRDIKPANILFGADDRPRLVDFGVAKLLDRAGLSRTGDFAGSLAYASPEQLVGAKAVDGGTDIWSLGVVAYELLAGRRPFVADGHEALIRAILSREPDPLDAPADLVTIVRCALEKERQHRYATAADLAADLGRFLRREPIAAEPPGTVSRLLRFVHRRRGAVVTAVCGLILVAVAGFAWWQNIERGEELDETVQQASATREQLRETEQREKATREQLRETVQGASAALEQLRAMVGTGRVAASPEVIEQKRRRIESVVQRAEGLLAVDPSNVDLRRTVARVQEQTAVFYQAIKATDASVAAHSRSIELLTPAADTEIDHVGAGDLAGSYHNRHVLYRALGRNEAADEDLAQAIGLWSSVIEHGPEHLRRSATGKLALALANRARRSLGSASATRDLQRAEKLWSRFDDRIGGDPRYDSFVAHRLQCLAVEARHLVASSKPDGALRAAEQLIERLAALADRHREQRAVVSLEGEVRELRAVIRRQQGDIEGAEEDLVAAVDAFRRLAVDGTADNRSAHMRSRVLLLTHLERARRAERLNELLPAALVDARALVEDHPLPLSRGFLSTILLLESNRLSTAGADAEAEAVLAEAVRIEAAIGSGHDFVSASAHARYAQLLAGAGETERAIEVADDAFRLVLGRARIQVGSSQPITFVRMRASELLRLLDRQRELAAMVEVADSLSVVKPTTPLVGELALLALDRAAVHADEDDRLARTQLDPRGAELIGGVAKRAVDWLDRLDAEAAGWRKAVRTERLRWMAKHAELGPRLEAPATGGDKR